MSMLVEATTYQFDDFLVDLGARSLFLLEHRGGRTPVPLGSRAFDILCVLIERRDEFVSKQEMLDTVWPNLAIEENNLTVQIAALRRVLDEKRTHGSCIQTVPRRGYRFLPRVTRIAGTNSVDAKTEPHWSDCQHAPTDPARTERMEEAPIDQPASPRNGPRFAAWAAAASCLPVLALLVMLVWHTAHPSATTADRPRLSVVVLPFQNLSGNPADDYLAEGITDDLTSDLAHVPDASVIARESAYTYQSKPRDVRKVGEELGVRYVLEGSVRRHETTLRVNVQLTSADTGALLWSDRFDEQIGDLASGQEQIVARMRSGLDISMVAIENTRSLRERPTNPDAFDLILRARSLLNLPPSRRRNEEGLALCERALLLDPSSAGALNGVAYFLLATTPTGGWGDFEKMERVERLLAQARAIAPDSERVLSTTVWWLRSMGRCPEVIEAAEQAIRRDPNRIKWMTGVYNELGQCKTWSGHAEEEIGLQANVNQLNPRSPWMYRRYDRMGFASLMLGRDLDAISYLQRSLAMDADDDVARQATHRQLAAAYARNGQAEEAKHSLAAADRLWPYDTVRGHWPDDSTSTIYAEQIRGYQAALHLAGERDHAEENADFGVPIDRRLHSKAVGLTPKDAPGAKTIRTADLVRMLAEDRPIVVDTMTYSWGRSIPAAIGLRLAGLGGSSFTDAAQDHLRSKLRELTNGDLNRSIIAVGWNSERFDGRNLALRLVALGYANVYWYRGGREAWEVNGLPETELTATLW